HPPILPTPSAASGGGCRSRRSALACASPEGGADGEPDGETRETVTDFELSPKTKELGESLRDFMDSHVYPNEAVWYEQVRESGDPYFHPPVMEEMKREAQSRGLWNLFLPD